VIEQGVPEPAEPWSPAQRARLHEIAAEVFDDLERQGRTGRAVTWRVERARLHRLLDRVLDADDTYRAARGGRPVKVEMRFGVGDVPPVAVPLPDGRQVQFRGFADRVDRTDDGRWIVLDYKTARAPSTRTSTRTP